MSITERQTIIGSNGSKWAGESPDSLEQLCEVLRTEPLDPSFEKYGDFVYWAPAEEGNPAMIRFWGNFYRVSHVFQIDTNDPHVIDTLTQLIQLNKATSAYAAAKREQFEFRTRTSREQQRRQPKGWKA